MVSTEHISAFWAAHEIRQRGAHFSMPNEAVKYSVRLVVVSYPPGNDGWMNPKSIC